ncbi:MAG: Xaa-Pro peptidase family protein [Clostridia bacterium]|nr:Xaa-Pro peptidase family protein [Clostridia bacterium]
MDERFKSRLDKFREKLREMNIEAALVTKRENYAYLSGFTGSTAWLVISQEDASLITDFRYAEQAARQAHGYNIVRYQGSALTAINDIISGKRLEALGFEETGTTYDKYLEYKDKLNVKGLVPLKGAVESLRIVKDSTEIETIKKAVSIADQAFAHVLSHIRPGVAEMEIAAEIEYFMKKQGAKGASFETIVASGERAAMPHGVASERRLKYGDVITLDFGAIYNDYCSDMTRTVFLGQPDEELKKIYGIVLKAQKMAASGAFAGLTGRQIDCIARDFIAGQGFGEYFGHGLGHGVGLEIHEEPRLSTAGCVEMKDGMVVTAEPGIYIPGLGGVRIEDIVVINGDSPIILTQSAKDLIII